MNCTEAESQISEYLDGELGASSIARLETHISSCDACLELREGMEAVRRWGHEFARYSPPEWLATRIIANTPRIERETWWNTLGGIGRWILDTRTATAVFTASVMLGWMMNVMGVSVEPSQLRDPQAIYYSVDSLVGDAYDRAVRLYYQAPLLEEIQSRIEQLRESSG